MYNKISHIKPWCDRIIKPRAKFKVKVRVDL